MSTKISTRPFAISGSTTRGVAGQRSGHGRASARTWETRAIPREVGSLFPTLSRSANRVSPRKGILYYASVTCEQIKQNPTGHLPHPRLGGWSSSGVSSGFATVHPLRGRLPGCIPDVWRRGPQTRHFGLRMSNRVFNILGKQLPNLATLPPDDHLGVEVV